MAGRHGPRVTKTTWTALNREYKRRPMDDSEHLITTVEAAKRLGVSRPRVQQYISGGRLKARKIGRDLLIDERDLTTLVRRRVGRPSTKADGTPGR